MKEKGELFNDFFTVATFCFSYIGAETTVSWLTPFVYTPSLKEGKKMAGSHIAHAAYKGPSVVKEIMIGIALGIVAGGLWKMHHWNNQRRTKEFYDLLDKNEISVVKNDE